MAVVTVSVVVETDVEVEETVVVDEAVVDPVVDVGVVVTVMVVVLNVVVMGGGPHTSNTLNEVKQVVFRERNPQLARLLSLPEHMKVLGNTVMPLSLAIRPGFLPPAKLR